MKKTLAQLLLATLLAGCALAPRSPAPPPPDPAIAAGQAQLAIMQQAALLDAQIKRDKAEAELAISQFKARQWAEIERFKAGLRAELREVDILNRKGAMPS